MKPTPYFKVQRFLLMHGYDCGPLDADFGERSVACLKRFERDNGLPETGDADNPDMQALLFATPEPHGHRRTSPIGVLAILRRAGVVLDGQHLDEAVENFRWNLKPIEREVEAVVTVPLKPYEFDALVSLRQSGGEIAWIAERLNAGDHDGAVAAFLKDGDDRRTAEHRQFASGHALDSAEVMVRDTPEAEPKPVAMTRFLGQMPPPGNMTRRPG